MAYRAAWQWIRPTATAMVATASVCSRSCSAGCDAPPNLELLDKIYDKKAMTRLDVHAPSVLRDSPWFKGAVYHNGAVMWHNSCLSNWWQGYFQLRCGAPVQIDFNNSEGVIMAIKERICLRSLKKPHKLCDILVKHAPLSPRESKGLPAKTGGSAFPLWDDHAFQVLLGGAACLLKFSQDPQLRDFLLNTGDAVLLETAPCDGAWGVAQNSSDFIAKGMKPEDYTLQSRNEELFSFKAGNWEGQRMKRKANALGKCLMLVRSILGRHPGKVTDVRTALDMVMDEALLTPESGIQGLEKAYEELRQLFDYHTERRDLLQNDLEKAFGNKS